MKSSEVSEVLAAVKPVGVPTLAVPPNTCSMKLQLSAIAQRGQVFRLGVSHRQLAARPGRLRAH
jgi:hypothetical protein